MASENGTLKYEVELMWDKESGAEAKTTKNHTFNLDMDSEFGGKGRYPCPDELFLSALGGCFITTFLWFKERIKFNIKNLGVSVEGIVSHVGPKGYRITGIAAAITVEVDEKERENAKKAAELTREYCHLTRSIDSAIPINFSAEIKTHKSNRS